MCATAPLKVSLSNNLFAMNKNFPVNLPIHTFLTKLWRGDTKAAHKNTNWVGYALRMHCTPTFNATAAMCRVVYYNLLLFPREVEVWFGSYSWGIYSY